MKKSILLFISLLLSIPAITHPWKPGHYVIIDTDGGIDDMTAITMLLASPDVRVLAITVTPGAINADSAYAKVKSLLVAFHHEGIPVAINSKCTFRSPDFALAMKTSWGPAGLKGKVLSDCILTVKDIITAEKTKISFICLGGLSTPAWMMKDLPGFSEAVKEIIWSSDGEKGFNFVIDKSSATTLMKGDIPVRLVSGQVKLYDDEFRKSVSSIAGAYAAKITAFFSSQNALTHEYSVMANDDLVPVYLHYPGLFTSEGNHNSLPADSLSRMKEGILRILAGETVARNQVLKEMPADPSFYFTDVAPSVSGIIGMYGKDEWASGVLANELHRHLGTFAIIGVKMGIRAREYFNTGVDEFRVTSLAGSVPPLSCMNDGLQVSTGATPGHGLLTVVNDNTSPSAEFTYMNRKIRLTLKAEIAAKITAELKEINFVYGLDSNIYWELVRKNTIKYWRDLDRHEMFLIEEL